MTADLGLRGHERERRGWGKREVEDEGIFFNTWKIHISVTPLRFQIVASIQIYK